MKERTAGALLVLLLFAFVGVRLLIAFSTQTLTWSGYEQLRNVEHVTTTGFPRFNDETTGRMHVHNPIFEYLIAPVALIIEPTTALKIVPNLLFACTILLVYLITHKLCKNRVASLLATTLAAFTPVIFAHSINDANPTTLSIPLFFLAAYALLLNRPILSLVIGVLFSLTSPLIFLFLAGLTAFFMIAGTEHIRVDDQHRELLIFLLIFSIWSALIVYKKALLTHGLGVLHSYLPEIVANQYYAEFTLESAAFTVGVLPLAFGGYAAYRLLFKERRRDTMLITGLALATILALIAALLSTELGMLILSLLLCILAGSSIKYASVYLSKTKEPRTQVVLAIFLLLFFVVASAFPALSMGAHTAGDTPAPGTLSALQWARENTRSDARILATPKAGFVIEEVAQRAVLLDEDYLLVRKAGVLYNETGTIYRAKFLVPALTRLNAYSITHILLSDEERTAYGIGELTYADDTCLRKAYQDTTTILYEVLCDVRTE